MAQALQLLVIDRLVLMLEALKTERVLKQVYYTTRAIAQSPEFPFAYFRLAADRDFLQNKSVGGPPLYDAGSRILVSLVIKREATYTARELAELIDVVRRRIVSDLPDAECRISIDGLATIEDPLVANLYDDFGSATLAIDYSGLDQY